MPEFKEIHLNDRIHNCMDIHYISVQILSNNKTNFALINRLLYNGNYVGNVYGVSKNINNQFGNNSENFIWTPHI